MNKYKFIFIIFAFAFNCGQAAFANARFAEVEPEVKFKPSALVIGNYLYKYHEKLDKAKNDAQILAGKLGVKPYLNLTAVAIYKKINDFVKEECPPSPAAKIIWYSGLTYQNSLIKNSSVINESYHLLGINHAYSFDKSSSAIKSYDGLNLEDIINQLSMSKCDYLVGIDGLPPHDVGRYVNKFKTLENVSIIFSGYSRGVVPEVYLLNSSQYKNKNYKIGLLSASFNAYLDMWPFAIDKYNFKKEVIIDNIRLYWPIPLVAGEVARIFPLNEIKNPGMIFD